MPVQRCSSVVTLYVKNISYNNNIQSHGFLCVSFQIMVILNFVSCVDYWEGLSRTTDAHLQVVSEDYQEIMMLGIQANGDAEFLLRFL